MSYDYEEIVKEWFEKLKLPFVNYIRVNYDISYDDIMDLYVDVWMDLRKIILENRATDNKWRALIFKIGSRKARKRCNVRNVSFSLSSMSEDGKVRFNNELFNLKKNVLYSESKSIYDDPELQMVLGSELSYIPDPCNTLLKLYYYENFSMAMIAKAMNYKSCRSAITIKKRCLDKLKGRVLNAAKHWGII